VFLRSSVQCVITGKGGGKKLIFQKNSAKNFIGGLIMKRVTRLCAVLCAIAMLLSMFMAGCGDSEKTDSTTDTDKTPAAGETESRSESESEKPSVGWDTNKKDKVVISVINNYYTAGIKQMAEEYMKMHPETEVVVDVVADNDSYFAKLKTTITTDINTAPDIVHGNFIPYALNISWPDIYAKNYALDLTPMLDMPNPYNDNLPLRDTYDPKDIARAISIHAGKLGALPFDFVGIGFFYNKTVFDKYGLKVPETFEDLLDICRTLKEKGYEAPIAASSESDWIVAMIADIAYRPMIDQFLTLPGDAMYDPATMEANTKIDLSQINDPTFDLFAVINDEKLTAYTKKNGINNPTGKFIWSNFAELAQYFQTNWVSPDSAKVLTDFESQVSPIMCSGSWNVGALVADISQLPADKQFEWGTFSLPGFKNPPEGFKAPMRSLNVFGNIMSIINKADADHIARVQDVLMYWYAPKTAQMVYDVTLKNGNFVQGPPAIKGVELSEENALRLNGFLSEGSVQQCWFMPAGSQCLQQDSALYNSLRLKLTSKEITADEFIKQLEPILMRYIDDKIKKSGYDLDPATKDTPQE